MDSEFTKIYYLKEYEKLKDEQHKRIEFRDQMIYLTLAAVGAVFSFSLEKPTLNIALLVLPFVCVIMGWTYLTNDEKISDIGNYIRRIWVPCLNEMHETAINMHWEEHVRKDNTRKFRKRIQLMVDLSIFAIPGLVAIGCFFILHQMILWYHIATATVEVLAIIVLVIMFIRNSGK